ncbi:IclR family transcriptional regulator [Streptomyces minutiscleroticus]|uniref:Glycerol operon regulatory protein n=2 Tax=Streptomyces minutiscleroticus TaxID=68238 RepID=A0A918NGS4_9ACTN|nr:IclR family transcriptional regulator [Streptomyces minutiscleroticus]
MQVKGIDGMTTPHSGVPERSVVDRTLRILGAFDRENRNLTLSGISRRSGLPVATVHRIVAKLHAWGALEKCADGTYRIGLRLWETGALAPHAALTQAAQPHLVDLHRRTSAAVMLAVRDGVDSVCVSFLSDDAHGVTRRDEVGSRTPLLDTTVGLVLLAHANEAARRESCAAAEAAHPSRGTVDAAALRTRLAKVRQEGYAITAPNPRLEGHGAVAAPVCTGHGTVTAAVAVMTPARFLQPMKLVPQVRATAEAVSRSVRTDGGRMVRIGA